MPQTRVVPSTPLSVALVSDCYLPDTGGIEVQAHDLAVHLQAAGHRVVVVTTTPGPPEIDGVRVVRVSVPTAQRRLPLVPDKTPLTPSVFAEVARVLAAEDVDVAHFHGGILSPLAFKGAHDAQAAGLPTVVTTHCLWSYAAPMFALLDRRWGWSKWPVVFSAVSEVAAEPIRRIAGPGVDVVVLPNGIDVGFWAPPEPQDGESVDERQAQILGVSIAFWRGGIPMSAIARRWKGGACACGTLFAARSYTPNQGAVDRRGHIWRPSPPNQGRGSI